MRFVVTAGYPTGAVRVSFGYMSSFEDADAVVRVLRDFFVTRATDLGKALSQVLLCTSALLSMNFVVIESLCLS